MRVGSLFSGIGGIDLGLERAGMSIVWQCEIDAFASAVLAHHWPDVPNHGDVTQLDLAVLQPVDLICGGYPCQPFSYAGSRQGESDERHLWPYFAAAVRVLRPRYALLENVSGHLSLGFGRVLGDLAEVGYDVEWESVPAALVGAPHLRVRVIAVAHVADTDDERRVGRARFFRPGWWLEPAHRGDDVADADSARLEGPRGLRDQGERARRAVAADVSWWAVEPDVGRVAHGVPGRVDRLRALGNAVVPQVAQAVGRRIIEHADEC